MTRMLQGTKFIAFSVFLIVAINLSLVSTIVPNNDSQEVQYDPKDSVGGGDSMTPVTPTSLSPSSSTFIYYDTSTQHDDLVNPIDNQSTSFGLVPENSTTISTNETIGLDNGNQTKSSIDPVDQSLPSIFEDLLFEDYIQPSSEYTTIQSIVATVHHELTTWNEVPVTESVKLPVGGWEIGGSTVTNDYLLTTEETIDQQSTTVRTQTESESPSTVASQSTTIDSIVTQPSTEIGTDYPEVKVTTQSSETETIHSTTDYDEPSVITENVTEQSTSITPSLTTIDATTIDSMLTTNESNQIISTTPGQSTLLPIDVTTFSTESSETTTIGATEETPQSTEDNQDTSTTTMNPIDWVQSTTNEPKSDDPTTTITPQLLTTIATESSISTTTTTEETIDQQSTTIRTQTESESPTTMWPEVSSTTLWTDPWTETISITTNEPKIETTTNPQPKTEMPSTTYTIRPEITTTTIRPEHETTTHSVATQPPKTTTRPETTIPEVQPTTTIKPKDPTTTSRTNPPTRPQVTTTTSPETTTHVEPQTTIKNDDPMSDANIQCDCGARNFDDKLECRLTCDSSVLANFHINLTFLGLKIAMILSNRDYVIFIAIGLGCSLFISGIVFRIVHVRRRRKLIAQRNFDILYQDFGTSNEKNMKWLSDYQSSIL